MIDREKVIKGLECCVNNNTCNKCDYKDSGILCVTNLEHDAITLLKEQDGLAKAVDQLHAVNEYLNEEAERFKTLLKEQEAKCLTKAELDNLDEHQFAWIEDRTECFYCLQIIGICRGRTGVSDIQFNTPTSYVELSTNTYGKSWRIWTNEPTEEQRQEVKWE